MSTYEEISHEGKCIFLNKVKDKLNQIQNIKSSPKEPLIIHDKDNIKTKNIRNKNFKKLLIIK